MPAGKKLFLIHGVQIMALIEAALASDTPDPIHVLVLHGVNLNMLGTRQPEIYGTLTLHDINNRMRQLASELRVSVTCFDSNHEGMLIDKLHDTEHVQHGVVFNPGAYTHYSYALYDAIKAISAPVVEVHLSDISKRGEKWRRISVTEPACIRKIMGGSIKSYEDGLRHVVGRIRGEC